MIILKKAFKFKNKTRFFKISSFIDQIAQDNSDISSTYIAGKSSENRLLKVIVLKPFSTSTRSLWIGKYKISITNFLNLNNLKLT